MERLADIMTDRSMPRGSGGAPNTLAEADTLNEQGLGYPLNLMCSLYYETTTDEPFHHPAGSPPPNPDDSDE